MTRSILLLSAILVLGCSDNGTGDDGGNGGDGNKPLGDVKVGKEASPPACAAVTIEFAGEAATIAQKPIGLDSTYRTSPVSGTLSYFPCIADTKHEDPKRSEYDHSGVEAFSFTVANKTVTGSGNPMVVVEDYNPDTFRYKDGPQLLDKDKTWRRMSLDGVVKDDLKVSLSITDGTGAAFSSDALPKAFPMLDIGNYTHTFSVSDTGGTMLMQLSSLTQK